MNEDGRDNVSRLVEGNRKYTAACSHIMKAAEEHGDISMLMDISAVIDCVDILQKTFISVLDKLMPVPAVDETEINENTH